MCYITLMYHMYESDFPWSDWEWFSSRGWFNCLYRWSFKVILSFTSGFFVTRPCRNLGSLDLIDNSFTYINKKTTIETKI